MGRPVPELDNTALDPDYMLGTMRGFVREGLKSRPIARSVAVEHLERRLLRYHVHFDSHPTWSVIGKVYENPFAGQRSFNGMRRLWDGGRKIANGPGGTVQLTLHAGDRIPLDHISNNAPTADCRAVGLGLEVKMTRTGAGSVPGTTQVPLGSTPGGAKPVDAIGGETRIRAPAGRSR